MNAGVEVKTKSVVVAIAVGCIALYWLWSTWSRRGSSNSPDSRDLVQFHTWKTKEFVDIPDDVLQRLISVKIEERRSSYEYDGEKFDLLVRHASPIAGSEAEKSTAVVLLHGHAFSSENWLGIKTLSVIAAMGHSAYALDLPGYGKSVANKVTNYGDFLAAFMKSMKIDRPIIVSPSMSGSYALPYLMGNNGQDSATCTSRARGYIPIAPVGTEKYTDAHFYRCEVPTMIVYGSKDTTLGLISLNHLRNMQNSEIMEMPERGHACYIEDPDHWHRLLYNFLMAVEREQN